MARLELGASALALDPLRDSVCPLEGLGDRAAPCKRGVSISLHDAERVEAAGDRRALVESAQSVCHAREQIRLTHPPD